MLPAPLTMHGRDTLARAPINGNKRRKPELQDLGIHQVDRQHQRVGRAQEGPEVVKQSSEAPGSKEVFPMGLCRASPSFQKIMDLQS